MTGTPFERDHWMQIWMEKRMAFSASLEKKEKEDHAAPCIATNRRNA